MTKRDQLREFLGKLNIDFEEGVKLHTLLLEAFQEHAKEQRKLCGNRKAPEPDTRLYYKKQR